MKEQITQLISQNRLFEAIKLLHSLRMKSRDRKSLMLLEGRLNDLNEKNRLGILSEENTNVELNKIRNGLFELCENISMPDEDEKNDKERLRKRVVGGLILMVLVITASIFSFTMFRVEKCEDRKVAILIADFQNTEKDTETDGFANSLVTRIDNSLDDSIYDVSPVGRQSRQIRRYDDFIKGEHFESTCDTSGLFVNGFLSLEQKVFNVYITIANLKMQVPDLSLTPENSIIMDNPSGIEFSITNNATFLADFIIAIIKSYEGKPYEALEKFFELEKNDAEGITRDDKNFKATIAHFKGNCYAMRGDNSRAYEQYKIVDQYGNPELKKVARRNRIVAKEVNEEMRNDPELRKKLNENKKEHSNFEKELLELLKKLGIGVDRVFRNLR